MIETVNPREQNGRDTYARYKAQVRSAAIASLLLLEDTIYDRIYCDLHDDFVIRINKNGKFSYRFYQVKTKNKQNYNWTANDIFGLVGKSKNDDNDKIKKSFFGKLIIHTINFPSNCESVVFQTNIHVHDNVHAIINDIKEKTYSNSFTKRILDSFNDCFLEKEHHLLPEDIKLKLTKLGIETDVQYLKNGNTNFEPLVRDKIYQYSEVDLSYYETQEIIIKLLSLIDQKSSGIIENYTIENIEKEAGVSITEMLTILSISEEAYLSLKSGGDEKAIKSVSIIQRTLKNSGATEEMIIYCSRCKSLWDNWIRMRRHTIPELDYNIIVGQINKYFIDLMSSVHLLKIYDLKEKVTKLKHELKSKNILFDLDNDLILGGFLSEIVKAKS